MLKNIFTLSQLNAPPGIQTKICWASEIEGLNCAAVLPHILHVDPLISTEEIVILHFQEGSGDVPMTSENWVKKSLVQS